MVDYFIVEDVQTAILGQAECEGFGLVQIIDTVTTKEGAEVAEELKDFGPVAPPHYQSCSSDLRDGYYTCDFA